MDLRKCDFCSKISTPRPQSELPTTPANLMKKTRIHSPRSKPLFQTSGMTRRHFIHTGAAASAALMAGPNILRAGDGPEPLRVAAIGCGGKGNSDIDEIARGNVVRALCDIDDNMAANKREQYPDARYFHDFREMLDTMGDEIDVVTVSTADHSHFPAALAAMRLGKPVFVQKPLTNTIWEARVLANMAAQRGIPTVMGNQGATFEGTRRIKEILNAGVIGDVVEVHCYTNRPIWPQGRDVATPGAAVPDHVKWDLFLAQVATEWEYSPEIHPFKWRGFWDFGSGAIGDIACHAMHAGFWALDLRGDFTVEAENVSEFDERSFPERSAVIYHFPERNGRPPIKLVWQDGVKDPNNHPGFIRPEGLPSDYNLRGQDGEQIFIGTEGVLIAPDIYGRAAPILLPESLEAKASEVPRSIPRVRGGPTQELCAAIRGEGPKPVSNFEDVAAPLTEMSLAGNLAIHLAQKIDWDSDALEARNLPEAKSLIKREYRDGWEPDLS